MLRKFFRNCLKTNPLFTECPFLTHFFHHLPKAKWDSSVWVHHLILQNEPIWNNYRSCFSKIRVLRSMNGDSITGPKLVIMLNDMPLTTDMEKTRKKKKEPRFSKSRVTFLSRKFHKQAASMGKRFWVQVETAGQPSHLILVFTPVHSHCIHWEATKSQSKCQTACLWCSLWLCFKPLVPVSTLP